MKAVTIKQLKDELSHKSALDLKELCLHLARFKKENKELLTYLLFESHDEESYIQIIKDEVDIQFDEIISLAEKFKISDYGRVIGFKDDAEFLKKKIVYQWL